MLGWREVELFFQEFHGKGATYRLQHVEAHEMPKSLNLSQPYLKKAILWFITIILGTAIKTNATKLLNDLRITRQNLLATFIDEVAKPEQIFVSNKNQTKPINRPILPKFQEKLNAYLELMLGLADCDSEDNKLRLILRGFIWFSTSFQIYVSFQME